MSERLLATGNVAVAWGAINAGCDAFFGYPITPQNEVINMIAKEFPERGKTFVQSQSETASIMMVYGGAAAGFRIMTSTAGPGWSLMQEGMSHLAGAELSAVIVVTQRGGPGQGTVRHSQMDYLCVTRGGGAGGYKTIVLAPSSVQEVHDLMQLAFHLSDKYRNPAVVLSDGVIGLFSETLELKTLDFDPLPEKEWAVRGRDNQTDGDRRFIDSYVSYGKIREGIWSYGEWLEHQTEKYRNIADNETRYEAYQTEDAQLILVAFGYVSRVCKEAINRAREEGLKVGLIRPITLWPFPTQIIRDKADQGCKVLVVEDNLGQMIDDVRLAVEGKTDVHFLGMLSRHLPTEAGIILPGTVLEKIRSIS